MNVEFINKSGGNFMKAMLIDKYGEPDVFRSGDIEKPKIKDGELLFEICACANPVEYVLNND
jgi:NADPH:quinone reductase-like Zn-dependent oxidoreductase